jgi:hypothetical protein
MWLNLEDSTYAFEPHMVQIPQTYEEVIDIIDALLEQEHGYKTLIIDTLDKLEILMTTHACLKNGWKRISDPDWGRGYDARTADFKVLWEKLRELTRTKNMIVVLIAHSALEKVQDPILPAYDTHAIQIYKKERPLVLREADLVGYCMIESFTSQDGKRNVATTAGERQIRTWPHPAYDAKTRCEGMPEILPMAAKAIMNCYSTKKPPTPKEEN